MAGHGLDGVIVDVPWLEFGPTVADQDKLAEDYIDRDEGLDKAFEIAQGCADTSIMYIGSQYFGIKHNPHGRSFSEQFHDCAQEYEIQGFEGLDDQALEERLMELDYGSTPNLSYCVSFARS